MSYLDEFLELINQMRAKFSYDFDVANFYGIADFRRNEWVFYGKKAVREFIRRHEPYAQPYRKTELSAKLNKAVMLLWIYPELFDQLDQEVTAIYNEVKGSQ